jgi:hypothetical protein
MSEGEARSMGVPQEDHTLRTGHAEAMALRAYLDCNRLLLYQNIGTDC